MRHQNNTQSGNILFLILIAVVLFAALSFALSNSTRGGEKSGNEKNTIGASEMTQYASAVENAVMMLKVSKACEPESISFEPPPFDGNDDDYVNPSSPADFSCHVFHPDGGRISVLQPPKGVNDGRPWAYIDRTIMKIGADQTSCGAACNDLVIVLGGLNEATCKTINKKITGSDEIPVQLVGGNYEKSAFKGEFETSDTIGTGAAGLPSLCIQDDFGVYYFYHVLVPR
jgi:hypothetical protein